VSNAVTPDGSPTLTADLVERALATQRATLPADVVVLAQQCLLDCLGVAIAGSSDPIVDWMVDDALDQGGRPSASLLGRSERVAAAQAARINGTSSHVLDYDDVNLNINGHPSAVLVPALLAIGEGLGRSVSDLLTAFVAGYETSCRIGRTIPGHYGVGFHATATVGTFGASMACAHLLGLSPAETTSALGIAGMQAAGLKATFGTPGKPIQVGFAAENAVRSALLAQRGVTSRDDLLEASQGVAATHAPMFLPDQATADRDRFFIRETLFKYHAACFNTHSVIEAIRNLRATHAFDPERVRTIQLRVARAADAICNIAEPQTGLEAKFSLRFCAALASTGTDTSNPTTFSDAVTQDPDLVRLRDRTTVELMDHWPHMQAEVDVEFDDGGGLHGQVDAGTPSHDLELQGARLREKHRSLTAPILGDRGADRLLAAVDALDSVEIAELVRLCRSH
jgi:2-methylcitrate dehydratase PrpD